MAESDSEYSDDSSTDEEAAEEEIRKLEAALETGSQQSVQSFSCSSTRFPNAGISDAEKLDNIAKALSYNKLLEEKYNQLEKILINRLKEIRQRLSEINLTPLSQRLSEKQQYFRYVYCGKPYFRDKDNFPPPDNEDTLTMEKAGMYNYSDVSCVAGWTVKDKSEFLKQILKMSQKIRKNKLESELAALHRLAKKNNEIDSKKLPQEIMRIKKQIDGVNKLPLSEDVVLDLDEEYDWDALASSLNYRHNAEEYRALWKLFLHPKINKKKWDKAEHIKLRQIAMNSRLQDWEKIAKELGTGRTSYQCFVYYRTNMGNSLTRQKWTKEEEEYLRRLIEYYREENYIPWGKVASAMENRVKIQIYNKYARLCELRKGRWLAEEDAVLLTGVEKFGPEFKKIIRFLPGRSCAQLRTRYNVLHNSNRTSVVWTVEEDRKLIQIMANEDTAQYINYAGLTKHFPGKDRVHIRARYLTLVKWMRRHPNKDVLYAPRRGARRLCHGQGEGDMMVAVENLKKRIKCEIEHKKSKRVTINSSEDVIEHGIITALVNESAEEDVRKQSIQESIDSEGFRSSNSSSNEANLRKLLILLKSKLNRKMFEESPYAQQYPQLKQADKESFAIKIKSYSKKAVTNLVKVEGHIMSPDIWGNNKLTSSSYVLPPNYATITGCRRLMAFASRQPIQNGRTSILNQFIRRNILVKDHVEIFMDRINTLFLWPMLLSNVPPKEKKDKKDPHVQKHVEKHVKRRERLLGPISVVIPENKSNLVNEIIDLPGDDNNHYVMTPNVGNTDFMYLY